jgi:hypothetical protein
MVYCQSKMSADNRICYMRCYSGQWAVWGGGGSQDYSEPPDHAELFWTEEEAVAFACSEERGYAEYGVSEISKDEQIKALAWEIQHLAERLDRLMRTGSQWKQLRNDDDWPYHTGGELPEEAK